jgi:DNA processing protein
MILRSKLVAVIDHKATLMDEKDFWRNEKVAFLALATVKGVGFWTIHKIAQARLGFKDLLKEPEVAGLAKPFIDAGVEGVEGQEQLWAVGLAEARRLASDGITLLFKDEPGFPAKLRNIPDAPEWIFVQGSLENLRKPAVAIVGTRKPSEDGLFLTRFAVAALSRSQIVTVSGLALGIDQIAHSESIRYQIPTIAVLGTGILQDYPKGSEKLRSEILMAGGTVITEYLPSQSYSAENFVRRNRLQAALGDVLVPAEWKVKSGTAHTVKFAHNYGKRIVNLCLPDISASSPEIAFSQENYGATTLTIPFDVQALVAIAQLIKTAVEPSSSLVSSSPATGPSSTRQAPSDPQDPPTAEPDLLSPGEFDSRQLPLI